MINEIELIFMFCPSLEVWLPREGIVHRTLKKTAIFSAKSQADWRNFQLLAKTQR
jgi:hypothetical protein